MTAKDLESVFDPACLLLGLEASTFEGCLTEFEPIVRRHPAVRDPEVFLDQVRLREAAASTVSGEGVAFPHARTAAVSRLFVAIGRARTGIPFQANLPWVHLVFLIGTPPDGIAEYLGCMAWLARCVRTSETRRLLVEAETSEAFLKVLSAPGL